jgi:hypothetical protein
MPRKPPGCHPQKGRRAQRRAPRPPFELVGRLSELVPKQLWLGSLQVIQNVRKLLGFPAPLVSMIQLPSMFWFSHVVTGHAR